MKQRADGRFVKVKKINGVSVSFYSKAKNEKLAQKDIEAQMLSYMAKESDAAKFGALANEWLTVKRETVGYKTYCTYKSALDRLADLRDMSIDKIQPSDVQSIINRLYHAGLSKTVILRAKGVISMVFDFAIGKNIKVYNFTCSIQIPKNAKRTERRALTDEEIEIVRSNVDNEFGFYAFFLMYTGCRRGEALALQWQDVDLDKGVITITKSVEYASNTGRIKAPKSKNGIRHIPILAPLTIYLTQKRGQNSEYIFGGSRMYSETMLKRRWDKYLKMTGLNITQHQLRHTYATMLYRAEIDAKTAQKLLGHSDVGTTLNIYTHIGQELDQKITGKLNEYLKNSI